MEFIILPVAWWLQFNIIAFIPKHLIEYVGKHTAGRKKQVISCAIVAAVILSLVLTLCFPLVTCPDEYKEYIDEKDMRSIQSIGGGIYSMTIPVFTIWIEVTYANETEIDITSHYFPIGTTKTNISDDGPWVTRGLFGYQG